MKINFEQIKVTQKKLQKSILGTPHTGYPTRLKLNLLISLIQYFSPRLLGLTQLQIKIIFVVKLT